MNPDSKNFDALKRLLALKRHEQPPPGYFNHFSRDVMARIKAGDSGDEMGQLPWFQHVLAMFDVKPVYAGVFGMAVCALLISGVIVSETPAPSIANNQSGSDATTIQPVPVEPAVLTQGSSNAPSLFDQFQPPMTHLATERYWVPSGNPSGN